MSNSSPKSKVQTSVLGLGVNFVFPLSQQQQEKQEEEPPPKSKLEFSPKSNVQTSVLGLKVDFVSPLSQQQQEQQQEEPSPKSIRRGLKIISLQYLHFHFTIFQHNLLHSDAGSDIAKLNSNFNFN